MAFFIAVFKCCGKGAFLITLLVMYFTLMLAIHAKDPSWHKAYYSIIGTEFIRGIYSIGLGIICGFLSTNLRLNKNFFVKIFFTISEIACLFVVFSYILKKKTYVFLEVELAFAILLYSIASSYGYLSSFFNGVSKVTLLSRYSYQVFLMHIVPLLILKENSYGLSDVQCVGVIITAAIVLGILEYHLVEKTLIPFLAKQFKKQAVV